MPWKYEGIHTVKGKRSLNRGGPWPEVLFLAMVIYTQGEVSGKAVLKSVSLLSGVLLCLSSIQCNYIHHR